MFGDLVHREERAHKSRRLLFRNQSEGRHRTHFTNTLKYSDCVFEVTNVEDRHDELDIGIMTYAVDCRLTTGFTKCIFVCSSLDEYVD